MVYPQKKKIHVIPLVVGCQTQITLTRWRGNLRFRHTAPPLRGRGKRVPLRLPFCSARRFQRKQGIWKHP